MTQPADDNSLRGRSIFVSASIPDPERWEGRFDPLAITDAVVALARVILSAGGRIVTAAHPTIAPLLLYVAAEQPATEASTVTVYQSEVFAGHMPDEIERFESDGVGSLVTTPKVGDEQPDPRLAPESLQLMRETMFEDPSLSAAVFVGGMTGIPNEYNLFKQIHPDLPAFALTRPGGEAALLAAEQLPGQGIEFLDGAVYPAVARFIVAELSRARG